MSGTSPVALILGAEPNVGLPPAKAFASKGYRVAVAARSLKELNSTENFLKVKIDFTNPENVVKAFIKVKDELGILSVINFNGKSWH